MDLLPNFEQATRTDRPLVACHCRIDLNRPLVDATRHRLRSREALLTEPGCYFGTAHTVVAIDDNAFALSAGQLLLPRLEFAHRQQARAVNRSDCVLFGLAAIEQQELFARLQKLLHGRAIGLQR